MLLDKISNAQEHLYVQEHSHTISDDQYYTNYIKYIYRGLKIIRIETSFNWDDLNKQEGVVKFDKKKSKFQKKFMIALK